MQTKQLKWPKTAAVMAGLALAPALTLPNRHRHPARMRLRRRCRRPRCNSSAIPSLMEDLVPADSTAASRRFILSALAALPMLSVLFDDSTAAAQTEPLGSWNDGPAKQAILDFVNVATDRASANFVAPEDRIATFDQDGTLWVEHPLYTQAFFALDRVHELASTHAEWKLHDPFKSVLAN